MDINHIGAGRLFAHLIRSNDLMDRNTSISCLINTIELKDVSNLSWDILWYAYSLPMEYFRKTPKWLLTERVTMVVAGNLTIGDILINKIY